MREPGEEGADRSASADITMDQFMDIEDGWARQEERV
jgi:hypothetical protein